MIELDGGITIKTIGELPILLGDNESLAPPSNQSQDNSRSRSEKIGRPFAELEFIIIINSRR